MDSADYVGYETTIAGPYKTDHLNSYLFQKLWLNSTHHSAQLTMGIFHKLAQQIRLWYKRDGRCPFWHLKRERTELTLYCITYTSKNKWGMPVAIIQGADCAISLTSHKSMIFADLGVSVLP